MSVSQIIILAITPYFIILNRLPSTIWRAAIYISGGIGNTEFAGSDRFTINFGTGYRILLNDSFSLTVDFRNKVFDVDVFGENKVTNNLQFLIGAGWFF